MQDQKNNLAALDARVTNAINGGDLAAPYTYDLKNSGYSDSVIPNTGIEYQNVNGIWCTNPNGWSITRSYTKNFKVTENMRILSSLLNRDASGNTWGNISILLYENSTLLQRFSNSNIIDISDYKGKTCHIALTYSASGTGVFTINKLTVTNE